MSDYFRPHNEPARMIYDAIIDEAKLRKSRTTDEWIVAELKRVWQEARDYAQQHGYEVPTLYAIQVAEQRACGHVDYVSKWAYGVSELLQKKKGDAG